MATLSEIQASLTNLRAIRDSAAAAVQEGDNRVTYRSLNDIDALIARLEGEEALLLETSPVLVRAVRIHMSDGY